MVKEGLLLMALAVRDNPCPDSDGDWQAIWTLPDGSEFIEMIRHPETDRELLRTATKVKILCPQCGSSWTIADEGDGMFTADVDIVRRNP